MASASARRLSTEQPGALLVSVLVYRLSTSGAFLVCWPQMTRFCRVSASLELDDSACQRQINIPVRHLTERTAWEARASGWLKHLRGSGQVWRQFVRQMSGGKLCVVNYVATYARRIQGGAKNVLQSCRARGCARHSIPARQAATMRCRSFAARLQQLHSTAALALALTMTVTVSENMIKPIAIAFDVAIAFGVATTTSVPV